MIDMETVTAARERIAASERARIEALVHEEAMRIEHNRMMVATSQSMAASVERARQQRIAAHEQARSAARSARDRRDVLRQQRQEAQNKVGRSRADLAEAQKQVARHLPLDPNDFPNAIEIDQWRQRHGQLDEHCRRLSGRIGTEAAELAACQQAEWEAQAKLDKAASLEMELRP